MTTLRACGVEDDDVFVVEVPGAYELPQAAAWIARAGYADVCAEVQRLWVDGDKAAAAAAVPDELVLATYLIGTDDMVRERVKAYARAGVGCLRLAPQGKTAAEQIEHLEMAIDLIDSATDS